MKLQSIQILRGIAALLVVFYHIRDHEILLIAAGVSKELPLFGGIFWNGYAGVDLFFVISGFIMIFVTSRMVNGAAGVGEFLFARVTRIYPLWWVFAALGLAYFIFAFGFSPNADGLYFGSRQEAPMLYAVKSFFLAPQVDHPIVPIGWTLTFEMYFYLVFAALMFLPRRTLPIAFIIWGLLVVAGSFTPLANVRAVGLGSLIVHPLALEFIMGALIGWLVVSGVRWRPGIVSLVAVLIFVAALIFQPEETALTLQWTRVAWYGVPSALLIYGLAGVELEGRMGWAVPALVGGLISAGLFQMYGLPDTMSMELRRGAVILCTVVGFIAMLTILWLGWLGGQAMPNGLKPAYRLFGRAKDALITLGDWSYSLYLGHIFVVVATAKLFAVLSNATGGFLLFNVPATGWIANFLYGLICLIGSLVFAGLTYRFIERPLMRFFRSMRNRLFRNNREDSLSDILTAQG